MSLRKIIELCTKQLLTGNKHTKYHSAKQIEQLIQSQDDESNVIKQFNASGIFQTLTNFLSYSDYEIMYNPIISIIKIIVKSRKHHHCIGSIIKQILYLVSTTKTPTYGIFRGLSALSRSSYHREEILNENILNYLLSNININCLTMGTRRELNTLRSQSELLSNLLHLQTSVKGQYVKKRSDDISVILNRWLYINDHFILKKTCICFKNLNFKFISSESIELITGLLMSNNIEIVEASVCCLNRMLFPKSIDQFMKQNILQKLSKVFEVLTYEKNKFSMHILCILIEKFMRYSRSEYVVHRIIKYNIIQCVMRIINDAKVSLTWPLEIIWSLMDIGNEQHLYFMIFCQNIIPVLCDKNLYFKNIWIHREDKDNRCIKVFEKILKFGEENKNRNGGKNICVLLMEKYKGFDLIECIINKFAKFYKMLYREKLHSFRRNEENINVEMDRNESELIIWYFIRKHNIPENIRSIIMKFYFVKCTLYVNYLQIQLNMDGMVVINKNKQCGRCDKVARSMRKCRGCKYTFYCSRMCQKISWNCYDHKSLCHQIHNYCT